MAYNILQGGGDRIDALVEVIRRAAPDVVGLCECTQIDLFRARLGMAGIVSRPTGGFACALLYGESIRVTGTDADPVTIYNGLARIALGDITIVMTHLHPYSSLARAAEAQIAVAKARSAPDAIVMGDMNSLAPSDLPLDLSMAPLKLAARLSGPDAKLDATPLRIFADHGFVDLGARVRTPTFPTRLEGKRERYGCAARLDYALATPRLAARCTRFEVIDGDLAQRASDHLPVVAEFDQRS